MSYQFEYDEVIFAGLEEWSSLERCEFGIFVPITQGNCAAVWLPATTADPDVISQISSFKLGQVFQIVAEDHSGPLETKIDKIFVDYSMPVITIADPKATKLKL